MNSTQFPLGEMYATIKSVLDEGGEFTMITAGGSMLPLLRHRLDQVVLVKSDDYKKYDIVFCRRDDGSFVLHRIISKDSSGFVLSGDHHITPESGIQSTQIIGRVKSIIRNGKVIELDSSRGYKVYLKKLKVRLLKRKIKTLIGR